MADEYPAPKQRPKLQITFDDLESADTAATTPSSPRPPAPARPAPPPPAMPPVAPQPGSQVGAYAGWPAPAPQPPAPDHTYAVAAMAMNRKSAGVAVLLSLLLTGAGQMYCGRVGRGFAFFFGAIFSWVLLFFLIGLILLPIVVIWAAIDAASLANKQNVALLAAFAHPNAAQPYG